MSAILASLLIFNPPRSCLSTGVSYRAHTQYSDNFQVILVANPCYAQNVLGGINTPPPWSKHTIAFAFESWLLILSMMIIDPLLPAPWPPDQQRWSPLHANMKVDCWSSLRWLPLKRSSIPPGSTEAIASALTVDPLHNDCRSTPPTDFDFLILNIRIACVCI